MNPKIITLSDYRKNLSRYTKEAQEENLFYIVMIHGKPALEVRPARAENYLQSLAYKNEVWDSFDSPESFIKDLKKHHNVV